MVLKEEIRSRILNSTRELSLKTAETMAAITGVTGLGKGTLTFEDLGVPPASNEVIAMAEQNPDVILFSPEADLARESFIGLMGRDATDDEILSLMKGELVEVDNMPTLESRHLASTMMQQNMERVAKYGAIAEENGLDRDKFERAKVESDRNWNRMTINYAAEFELDPNEFRMAIHDRDNMRLRGRDDNEIDRIMRSRWGDDYGTFLRAADNFDRDFGNQQTQLARSMDMEEERFAKGMEQADAHEMRVEDTWNAITEGKSTQNFSITNMNQEFPDVQRSFVHAFQNIEIDPDLGPMEISSQLANAPELQEARQYLEDSQGKINDGAWRSFIGDMYASFQGNYEYMDPDTDIAFEFVDPPGVGRPVDQPSIDFGNMSAAERDADEFAETWGSTDETKDWNDWVAVQLFGRKDHYDEVWSRLSEDAASYGGYSGMFQALSDKESLGLMLGVKYVEKTDENGILVYVPNHLDMLSKLHTLINKQEGEAFSGGQLEKSMNNDILKTIKKWEGHVKTEKNAEQIETAQKVVNG